MDERHETTNDDMKRREISPDFLLVWFPTLFVLIGGPILLWLLRTLPIYYNYLRGAPSPIDQYVLANLGSDISRLVVYTCAMIGIILGSLVARVAKRNLDTLKKDGEVNLTVRFFVVLLFSWQFIWLPYLVISLIQLTLFEVVTSSFLSDINFAMISGYFLSFGMLVLLKYISLRKYAASIDSIIRLVEIKKGEGLRNASRRSFLKLIPITST